MTLVAILGFFAILFGVAFATKRRFGVLGLALAAGSLLAQYTSVYVGDFLESNHLTAGLMTYDACAILLITVLPALVLLAGGPTYTEKRMAIIGALGFATLATFFSLGSLVSIAPIPEAGVRMFLLTLLTYKTTVISIGLLAALVDTFLAHGVSGRHSAHDKH